MASGPWGFESPLSHLTLSNSDTTAVRRDAGSDLLIDHRSEGAVAPTNTETSDPRARFDFAVETETPTRRHVTITVDPDHVAARRRKEMKKIGKSVRLKGFRKGKVPPKVVEERYGPLVDERTVTALVNEGFREAVKAHELEAVGEPAVGDVRYEPGESLSFTVDVDVMPEIDIARTGGFRVKRPEVEVAGEEVDELIERMRTENAVLEPVDRAPGEGDVVSVRIRPVADGEEEPEAKPYRFELGAGYAIPDVEAAILTLEPGGSDTFDVTYPEDFGNEELAGSTRTLFIELAEVKGKRKPDLDDEFARQVGDFESLAALRDAVREDLRRHAEEEADRTVRERLLDALLEANPFEVPRGLVSRYLDRVIDAPEDADPERVEEARRSVRPAVERQIKRDLILDRLIELRGFEATPEEVDARLAEIAEQNDLSPGEVRSRLAREKRLDGVRRELAVKKAVDFLKSESSVAREAP